MKDTGLTQEAISRICKVIFANKKIGELILFGSRAKGTFRAGSDIDLAIKTNPIISFSELAELQTQLDDLMLPNEIDLVVFETIESKELIDHINRIGILLSNT